MGTGVYDRRGQLRNHVSIENRSRIVEDRTRLGDWELDTIIGKGHRQALVSLTARASRLALITTAPTKEAEGVTYAILKLLAPLSERVSALTADNVL